jgi:hypothetical protein
VPSTAPASPNSGSPLQHAPTEPHSRKRIRKALATPGRPGVRVIAKQFGVTPVRCSGSAALFQQDAVAL